MLVLSHTGSFVEDVVWTGRGLEPDSFFGGPQEDRLPLHELLVVHFSERKREIDAADSLTELLYVHVLEQLFV